MHSYSTRALLSACFFSLTIFISVAEAQSKPNIVLIISDDQAWMDYGFMKHPAIQTPHLDRLTSQSALFRRGYVPTALCRPSLMSIITGRYLYEHKVSGNDPSPKNAPFGQELSNQRRAELISHVDRFPTLPKLLGQAGYLSHQSGKWWEGNPTRGGFTHGMTRGFPQKGGRHGDDGLRIGREGMKPIDDFIQIANAEDKPFFLWYAPFLPHTPHNPPKRLLTKYKVEGRPPSIANYYAMCEWFDETCGDLFATLDKHGERDNTIIAYVCDNGWITDQKASKFAPRSKQSPNEGGVRTPIFYSWPGKIQPKDRPELATSLDLLPTLLAAAGVQAPEGLPGLNLLPHLRNNTDIPRDTLFGESCAHDIANVQDPEASLLYRWCIEGEWKALLTYDGEMNRYKNRIMGKEKGPQLYHLINDPHENTNLASKHPEILKRLSDKIAAWYPLKERKAYTSN